MLIMNFGRHLLVLDDEGSYSAPLCRSACAILPKLVSEVLNLVSREYGTTIP